MWRNQAEKETRPGNKPSSTTYLSTASSITGKLLLDNPTRIDGRLEGEIVATTQLTIGETAEITAQIEAPSVLVFGRVTGGISAKRIEIRAPAKIVGDLISPVLVVEEGSVLNCHCFMREPPSKQQKSPEREVNGLEDSVPHAQETSERKVYITKSQRSDLRARGYDDNAIDKMTPIEAQKILGLI
jgi:cytoskeletal protein CcmA (bactofilin family)